MYCRNCGKELIGTPEICLGCGARPSVGNSFCFACGAPTEPQAETCIKCGAQLIEKAGKTWKPTTAGILSIIAGVFGLISGIVVACVGGILNAIPWHYWGAPPEMMAAPIVTTIGAVLIVFGIVAIVPIENASC